MNLKLGGNGKGQGPGHRGTIFFVCGPNVYLHFLVVCIKNVAGSRGRASDQGSEAP